MPLDDLFFKAGLYAGAAAFAVLTFLVPLYIQQARDVRRLRAWAELTPDRGTAEFQAAEAAGVAPPAPAGAVAATATPVPAPGGTAPMPITPAARRVARELPAAARATAERPAIAAREPWLRRELRRPDPGVLVGIVVGVLVLGVAVGVLAIQLRTDAPPEPPGRAGPPAVVPGDVQVAVLNGTAVPGLADKVGDDLSAGGFPIGAIGNSPSPTTRSLVAFERGHEREAEAVGKRLGIEAVEPIDDEVREAVREGSEAIGAEPAAVVVIAGGDRAGL